MRPEGGLGSGRGIPVRVRDFQIPVLIEGAGVSGDGKWPRWRRSFSCHIPRARLGCGALAPSQLPWPWLVQPAGESSSPAQFDAAGAIQLTERIRARVNSGSGADQRAGEIKGAGEREARVPVSARYPAAQTSRTRPCGVDLHSRPLNHVRILARGVVRILAPGCSGAEAGLGPAWS